MSTELENSLDNAVEALQNLVHTVLDIEPSIDPVNHGLIDFDKYQETQSIIKSSLEPLFNPSELLTELSFSRCISEILGGCSSDNGYNLKEIGIIVDFAFYLYEKNITVAELPILSLSWIIKDSSTEWLLKFWSYFEYRYYVIQQNPSFEPKNINKGVAISFIITLNFKLETLRKSFEISRDILRSKILNLANTAYPLFTRHLINKKFETNTERIDDIRSSFRQTSPQDRLARAFWNLQSVFQDPINLFLTQNYHSKIGDAKRDMDYVLHRIRYIEEKLNGGQPLEPIKTDTDSSNEIGLYEHDSLPDFKKDELKKYYDSKEFNPNYYIDSKNFDDQLKEDKFLRRSILIQIYIVAGFFDSFLHVIKPLPPATGAADELQPLRIAYRYFNNSNSHSNNGRFRDNYAPYSFLGPKKEVQSIFKAIDRRWSFSNVEIRETSESMFLNKKINQFKGIVDTFDKYEFNENIKASLEKEAAFKARYWALYGTQGVSAHWKIPIGLEILKKDEDQGAIKYIDFKIDELREKIKSNENNEDTKSFLNWKALRLGSRNHVFEFKNVAELTGVEGMFNPKLKEVIDIKKAQELAEKKIEEEKKALEKKLANEKLLKEAEERKLREEEEEEKKRKLELEKFEEDSKRAKLESAQSSLSAVDDLDY